MTSRCASRLLTPVRLPRSSCGSRAVLLGLRRLLETHPPHGEHRLGSVPRRGRTSRATPSKAPADPVRTLSAPRAIRGRGSARAYVTAASDDPADGGRLVVEARDGSSRQEIPVAGAAAFSFDPTSTTLAFIAPYAAADPPAPIPSGPLRTVDAAAGEVRTLRDGSVLAFFWSPDGRAIAALDIRPADSRPGPRRGTDVGRSPGLDGLRRERRPPSRRSLRKRRASGCTCHSSTPRRAPSAPSATSGFPSCSRSRWSPTSTSTRSATASGPPTAVRSCCRSPRGRCSTCRRHPCRWRRSTCGGHWLDRVLEPLAGPDPPQSAHEVPRRSRAGRQDRDRHHRPRRDRCRTRAPARSPRCR